MGNQSVTWIYCVYCSFTLLPSCPDMERAKTKLNKHNMLRLNLMVSLVVNQCLLTFLPFFKPISDGTFVCQEYIHRSLAVCILILQHSLIFDVLLFNFRLELCAMWI